MKTPEEIKRGLKACYSSVECTDCPYIGEDLAGVDCCDLVKVHAKAYIQQLEQDNAQKDERITALEREKDDLGKELDKMRLSFAQQTARVAEHDCEMLKAVQKAISNLPRWISVEDEQKPKHHEEVLCRYVFDGDSQCFYAVLTYYAYGDNGYVTGQHFTGEGLHDMRVTHWMPLPELPEEDANES